MTSDKKLTLQSLDNKKRLDGVDTVVTQWPRELARMVLFNMLKEGAIVKTTLLNATTLWTEDGRNGIESKGDDEDVTSFCKHEFKDSEAPTLQSYVGQDEVELEKILDMTDEQKRNYAKELEMWVINPNAEVNGIKARKLMTQLDIYKDAWEQTMKLTKMARLIAV